MIKRLTLFAAGLLLCTVLAAQQKLTVSGTVSDDEGLPLAGAFVMEASAKGGSSTATDADGRFTLEVSSATDAIRIEFMGYLPLQEKIGGRKVIDVTLVPDSNVLDEVVVIGYGETRKSDLTGSVATVKMEEVEASPVPSVDLAMQGKVAGADIMATSGDPTASASIRIRGTRSITASNEPLIVVDDVADAVQDLSDINSSDIESISILKDASATAIYGARGSNGVIIVTTTKGNATSSKPWVTVKADVGFARLARTLDTMTASEFAAFRNEIREYNNDYALGVQYASAYSDPASLGTGTNWIDAITRIAPYQKYNISAGGKNKGVNWYASAGYSDIEGIVKDSGSERFNARYNATRSFSKKFSASLKASLMFKKERFNKADIGGTNTWTGATYINPILDSEAVINDLHETGYRFNNPVYSIRLKDSFRKDNSGTVSAIFEYKPVPELLIKSTNTLYRYQSHTYRYYDSTLPTKAEGDGADIRREEKDILQLSADLTATWKKKVGAGNIDAMAGVSLFHKELNDMSIVAEGMLVDNTKWNDLSGIIDKLNYSPASYNQKLTRESVMTRLNYNYRKRYYITFTGRADASSNFAANHKWGFFPSVALKWVVSNEGFMKRLRSAVNELSLRASAGRTGNDAIAPYRSLEALASSTSGYLFDGIQSMYYYPSRVASPDLTWEKTDLYNLAADLSLFKGRISATLEGYLSYTSDLLLSVQKANQSGYSSFYENIGRTSNKGVELTLETRNIETKRFGWSTNLTLSHNVQMVEDIGSEDFVSALDSPGNNSYMMYGYVKGMPLNSLWGFQYGGVWKSSEEIEANKVTRQYVSQSTAKRGRARYIDQNHDGIMDQNDLVCLGNADPILYGGINNTFNLGNLTLSAFFTYSLGGAIYNYSEFRMAGSYTTNQYRYMMNAWHPVKNPESELPAAGSVEVHVPSNLQVHDASYLRLKTLTVSWRIPLRKKWIRDCTLSMSADNLWLLTAYNGFDPDVSTESESSTLRRVDLGAYPKASTIIFSIKARY